jgi:hypothetical protein
MRLRERQKLAAEQPLLGQGLGTFHPTINHNTPTPFYAGRTPARDRPLDFGLTGPAHVKVTDTSNLYPRQKVSGKCRRQRAHLPLFFVPGVLQTLPSELYPFLKYTVLYFVFSIGMGPDKLYEALYTKYPL